MRQPASANTACVPAIAITDQCTSNTQETNQWISGGRESTEAGEESPPPSPVIQLIDMTDNPSLADSGSPPTFACGFQH